MKVINGVEEADLNFRGVAHRRALTGLIVIADVGGAGTEGIRAEDGVVTASHSVQIGSGTLTDTWLTTDPPTVAEITACAETVTIALVPVALPVDRTARLVAVGGTAEHLTHLVGHGPIVSIAEIEHVLIVCQAKSSAGLAATLAIPSARARLLPAGIVIICAVANLLNSRPVELAPSGIRTCPLLGAFAAIANVRKQEQEKMK